MKVLIVLCFISLPSSDSIDYCLLHIFACLWSIMVNSLSSSSSSSVTIEANYFVRDRRRDAGVGGIQLIDRQVGGHSAGEREFDEGQY